MKKKIIYIIFFYSFVFKKNDISNFNEIYMYVINGENVLKYDVIGMNMYII